MNHSERTLTLADPLWRTLEEMSEQMGVPVDGLINQAVFTLARLNGFILPAASSQAETSPERISTPLPAMPLPRGTQPVLVGTPSIRSESVKISPPVPTPVQEEELEQTRLRTGEGNVLASSPKVTAALGPPAHVDLLQEELESASEPDPEEEKALEALEPTSARTQIPESEDLEDEPAHGAEIELFIIRPGSDPVPVAEDRFIIGRGEHCDLVIHSNRVSREHAALSKQGEDFVIEDLGSSNGTWYRAKRVQKHLIRDGDELMLGSEVVRFELR